MAKRKCEEQLNADSLIDDLFQDLRGRSELFQAFFEQYQPGASFNSINDEVRVKLLRVMTTTATHVVSKRCSVDHLKNEIWAHAIDTLKYFAEQESTWTAKRSPAATKTLGPPPSSTPQPHHRIERQ